MAVQAEVRQGDGMVLLENRGHGTRDGLARSVDGECGGEMALRAKRGECQCQCQW